VRRCHSVSILRGNSGRYGIILRRILRDPVGDTRVTCERAHCQVVLSFVRIELTKRHVHIGSRRGGCCRGRLSNAKLDFGDKERHVRGDLLATERDFCAIWFVSVKGLCDPSVTIKVNPAVSFHVCLRQDPTSANGDEDDESSFSLHTGIIHQYFSSSISHTMVDQPASSSDATMSNTELSKSALQDNIEKKGKNAYYYAHGHK
jgi:hypothetical protein